jgi:hypothetical protein
MGTGNEAPADGGGAMSAGDIEPRAVTEDTPRPPENDEDVAAAEEDAPRSTEAATDVEVPQV